MKSLLIVFASLIISSGVFAENSNTVPADNQYLVRMAPTEPAVHSMTTPTKLSVTIQVAEAEPLVITIGTIVNGNKNAICTIPTSGPITTTGTLFCFAVFPEAGTQKLYVDVDDSRWVTSGSRLETFPTYLNMFTCSNSSVKGCQGSYTLSVQ